MEFPSPDESLKKLWKEQHDGLEDTLNSIREKAVEEFARENEISRQEAWAVWLMATRPQSKESMRQELTERIVNMMYDATEAPWDDDYIKARELVNIMLSTSQNPEHRYPTYHYDEELMALSSSDLGKNFSLRPKQCYTWVKLSGAGLIAIRQIRHKVNHCPLGYSNRFIKQLIH